MVEISMYLGMGFLLTALGMLVTMPFVHGRAVRLTTRGLERQIPSCMAEILADKDLARAEFAVSTRRLEMRVDRLSAQSARQRAELGRKGDTINRLNLELDKLRTQLLPSEEAFALKDAEIYRAGRALAEQEKLRVRLDEVLGEQSSLIDKQKLANTTLKIEVGALTEQVDRSGRELKASQDERNTAVRHLQNVLNEKELELGELRKHHRALKEQFDITRNELLGAEDRYNVAARQMCDNEARLTILAQELTNLSNLDDSRSVEIITLKTRVEALKQQVDGAGTELKASESRFKAAAREVIEKEGLLAKLADELGERTALADSQKLEIVTLRTEVMALGHQLDCVNREWKSSADRNKADQSAAAQRLLEERRKFEHFHGRVGELVQQALAQNSQDERLADRVYGLEDRLLEQSRLLNERGAELEHLRQEMDIARQAEADLRVTLIESEEQENGALRNLIVENAKLQAAFERANGERVRLAYQVASIKQHSKPSCAA